MRQNFFNKVWWENKLKYYPPAQRLFLWLSLSNNFPTNINVEPTNKCNLSCVFCPVKNSNRLKGEIELNFYKKIIDDICRVKKLKVLWLNKDGESLIHKDIGVMIGYAKKKKAAGRIELYSNGSLLTDDMSEKLIKASLDSLIISLDAVDKDSFFYLKKKDVYKNIVRNIHNFLKIRNRLKAKKPLLTVKMIDLGNKGEIETFKKQWQGVADCVMIQPLHEWEGSLKRDERLFNYPTSKLLKRYPCNLPWFSPAINWDGKVVSCCVNYKENELVMGDLKKNSLTKIWRGEKYRNLRLAHLNQDFSGFPTCRRCSFWQQLPDMEFLLRRIGA